MSSPSCRKRPTRWAFRARTPPRAGWALFAGILIVMVGILNVIYGIAAIGETRFFVADQKYILSGLHRA